MTTSAMTTKATSAMTTTATSALTTTSVIIGFLKKIVFQVFIVEEAKW